MAVNDRLRPDFDISIEIFTLSNGKQKNIRLYHVASYKPKKKFNNPKKKLPPPPSHAESMHKIPHNLVQHAKTLDDILNIPTPCNRANISITEHNVNANVGKIFYKC